METSGHRNGFAEWGARPGPSAVTLSNDMSTKKAIGGPLLIHAPGGQATPASPIGPALGEHGINIMEFCKAFNAQTQSESGTIFPVEITVYEDRSFSFIIKTPPASVLIKQAAALEKGSGELNRANVGRITSDQVREIAERKLPDLDAHTVDEAAKIIAETARSMGIEVV